MKHKFLIFLLVLNEASGIAIAASKGQPEAVIQTIMGGIGLAVGALVLWLFARVGMFRGLKFRHYAFILLCVVLAMAGGYYLGQIGTR